MNQKRRRPRVGRLLQVASLLLGLSIVAALLRIPFAAEAILLSLVFLVVAGLTRTPRRGPHLDPDMPHGSGTSSTDLAGAAGLSSLHDVQATDAMSDLSFDSGFDGGFDGGSDGGSSGGD